MTSLLALLAVSCPPSKRQDSVCSFRAPEEEPIVGVAHSPPKAPIPVLRRAASGMRIETGRTSGMGGRRPAALWV